MGNFGEKFKKLRLKKGFSLREFCLKFGIDASNLSKVERGVLPPPQGEVLEKYLGYLSLKKGSNEWFEICDLAAAGRGKIPEDLVSDEKLLEKMPVFFRAARKSKNSNPETLVNELKKIIREAWTP